MLSVRGVSKSYGSHLANDAVSFDVAPGTIHALLGENGAGKSTLVKILYGAVKPDAGEIVWRGETVEVASPKQARELGIAMVFQHFSLFDSLTVADNVALAQPGAPSAKEVAKSLAEVSRSYGLPLKPDSLIADLSVGERQRVEIVRCLLQNPSLIILDEPTSVLTPQEADELFVSLERLKSEGRSILYISHKLDEVRRICQSATIMRGGRVVESCDPREVSTAELARMMVGAEIREVAASHDAPADAAVALKLTKLTLTPDNPFGVALRDVSMELRAGEVRAIAGIAGNGQSELFDAISGEATTEDAAAVTMLGKPMGAKGVTARRRLGAAFVSEERLGHSAAPDRPLSENVVLTRARTDKALAPGGFISFRESARIKDRVCKDFDVRKGAPDPAASELSGGNLQKFVVGREVDRGPKLLVVNQPTWGVDAGAAAMIRQTLVDLARDGAAVLVISQDLDEIFEIADRIAVLSEGRLSEFTPAAEATRESIGLLMTAQAESGGAAGAAEKGDAADAA